MTPPFDATAIASSHSALTGLMAGFALAALFLLIERWGLEDAILKRELSRAMLLLFIASIIGTLSSFLYSSIVGISQTRAYFDFVVSGPVFGITTFFLLAGVNEVLGEFASAEVITLARRISYFVVVFSVLRVWQDFSLAADIFDLGAQTQVSLAAAAIVPFVVAAVVLSLNRVPLLRWISHRTFTPFCYSSVLVSFGIAFLIAVHNMVPETRLRLPGLEAILIMAGLSLIGAWTTLHLAGERASVDPDSEFS